MLLPNPFGEEPPSWRQRLRNAHKANPAPIQYRFPAFAVGAVGATVGATAFERTTRLAVLALAGVPSLAVEWWWKRRTRRESERLLIPGSDAILASGHSN